MTIQIDGLPPGPIQNLLNAINNTFARLRSVPNEIVPDVAGLPKPTAAWQGRSIIVRDIDDAGTMGIATALDGAWRDKDGSAL